MIQIGSGRNGTAYLVRSTVAQKIFGCPFSVVLKEIRTKALLEHLHKPSLDSKGNLVCSSQVVSEVLNGALATVLVDDGHTPHFVRQMCFFSCQDRCFLVYEFCGYRLRNGNHRSITLLQIPKILKTPISEAIVMELLFVILHALWIAQRQHGQIHYDLKPDNLFVQPITSVSEFNGTRLDQVSYFGYCLSDIDGSRYCYYLPNRGYLLKMGDYGTMVSCDVQREDGRRIEIMPNAVFNNSEKLRSAFGIKREFQPGYDAHFFMPQLAKLCHTWNLAIPLGLSQLIEQNCCQVESKTGRPVLPVLDKTPYDLIMETDWTPYLTSPSNVQREKTVLIGASLW